MPYPAPIAHVKELMVRAPLTDAVPLIMWVIIEDFLESGDQHVRIEDGIFSAFDFDFCFSRRFSRALGFE
jgi:hypothetical protein